MAHSAAHPLFFLFIGIVIKMAQFSKTDIEKIATLARLQLTDEEKETFSEQFSHIMTYVERIQQAPTPEADATQLFGHNPHLRPDEMVESPVHPDQFSPHLERGHFKVPKVIE